MVVPLEGSFCLKCIAHDGETDRCSGCDKPSAFERDRRRDGDEEGRDLGREMTDLTVDVDNLIRLYGQLAAHLQNMDSTKGLPAAAPSRPAPTAPKIPPRPAGKGCVRL